MKTSRISLNQMSALMVLYLIGSATLTNVGRMSGQNIWIVLLCSSLIGVVLYTLFYRISKLHGFTSLANITKDVFGKYIGGLLALVYGVYFLYQSVRLLKNTGDLIQFTLMVDAHIYLIMGLLMAVIVYALILGVNALGRASELLFYVVIIAFIPLIIAVFSSDIFKFDNLLPILEKGWYGIRTDIYTVSMYPYGELITFLCIFPLIPKKKTNKILKYSYINIALATTILITIDVINVGILGSDLTYNFVYPFYNSMKMVGINVFFERLDPLAVIIVMITCFFKLSIYFYAALNCFDSLSMRFNYRQLTLPLGIIVVILGKYITSNRVENLYLAIQQHPRFLLPIFQVGIPILIWLVSEVKYRKHPKQLKSEVDS